MIRGTEDLLAFHTKFGLEVNPYPTTELKDPKTQALRVELIKEEVQELLDALEAGDLVGIADGAIDSMYVIIGTLVSYGIDGDRVWDEVQASNMAKEGGATREDGKILKPEGWVPPQIARVLDTQDPLITGAGYLHDVVGDTTQVYSFLHRD